MGDIFGMHKHHIIFRSQGGLDFDLNLAEMTLEEHAGDDGPHRNRETDLELKKSCRGSCSSCSRRAIILISIPSAGSWGGRAGILTSIFGR